MFRDLARRSAAGQFSCSVVFGSSTAGGAYLPGISDYTILVQNQAQVFLGGPPLVKMATGEVIDAETLGGAKMHSTVTGLADQIAVDEYGFMHCSFLAFVYLLLCVKQPPSDYRRSLAGLTQSAKPANGSNPFKSPSSWRGGPWESP